jgi:hypothetical protein
MKTVQETETEVILAMGKLIEELQQKLNSALDKIQELEKQVYGSR